jgi:Leucine-rich repeat (LRR) protein
MLLIYIFQLDPAAYPQSLKILDLSFNRISVVLNSAGLAELEVLHLDSNMIENILPRTFVGMKRLRELNLRLNSLITMSLEGLAGTLEKMQVLNVLAQN